MPSVSASRSRRITRSVRGAVAALFLIAGSIGIRAALEPERAVAAAFRTLQTAIAGLRAEEAPMAPSELLTMIGNAQARYTRGDVCAAAAILDRFLQVVANPPRGERWPAGEVLYVRAHALRQLILSADNGGQFRACGDPRIGMLPAVQVGESTNRHLTFRVQFGVPQLQLLSGGGRLFTNVSVPGLDAGSAAPGAPALPVWRQLVAVPRGGRARFVSVRPVIGDRFPATLYPYQPFAGESSLDVDRFVEQPPPDEALDGAPFTIDPRAYRAGTIVPPDPCHLTPAGDARDLQLAQVECSAGQLQMTAGANVVTLYASIVLDLEFSADADSFITSASLNPFERLPGVYTGAVLNQGAVFRYVGPDIHVRVCTGEELLILTAPAYLAEAQALKTWKISRGIPTSVVQVNDGAGGGPDTNVEIDNYIEDRYVSCTVRPSYVILFGDSNDVPTFTMQRLLKAPGDMIATDFPYATLGSDPEAADLIPDFAVGRLSVSSAAEAQVVVDKIVAYESAPPFAPSFYSHIGLASYFQCCRTDVGVSGTEDGRSFILNAEFLRDSLMGLGYTVDRIYDTKLDNTEYTGDPTPRRFADTTSLPDELLPPFAWDGNAQDVIAAINAGRTLFFHIDHGYTGGWGHPAFSTSNVDSLTNGNLQTILFNFNCSSGGFDSPVAFAEKLLRRAGGGAVGVFGWTRMSNTKYYRALIEGTLGALWPATLPSYGDGSVKARLGDLFNFSKIYMAYKHASWNVNSADGPNTLNHVRIYHFFGDPTLEARTGNPFQLPDNIELIPLPDYLHIGYPEDGAVITAWQDSRDGGAVPIARAVVRGGVARLTFVIAPEPGLRINVIATKPNAIARLFSVDAGQ
jgi:peptidase C25-like protein